MSVDSEEGDGESVPAQMPGTQNTEFGEEGAAQIPGIQNTESGKTSLIRTIINAMLFRPMKTEDTTLNAQTATRRVQITTGLETDYYTEIQSDEVHVGDSVLIPNSISTDSGNNGNNAAGGMNMDGGPGGGGPGGGPRGGGPGGGF